MWFQDTLYYDKPIDITIVLPPEQVTLTPFFPTYISSWKSGVTAMMRLYRIGP